MSDKIADRPRAGAGLSAWEAIQLCAINQLPLSHYGLSDTPENRKTVDKLRDEYDDMERRGLIIEIAQ